MHLCGLLWAKAAIGFQHGHDCEEATCGIHNWIARQPLVEKEMRRWQVCWVLVGADIRGGLEWVVGGLGGGGSAAECDFVLQARKPPRLKHFGPEARCV